MDVWFENYAKVKVRPSSHQTYRGYIDNHIKPDIGEVPLEKLTSLELQKLYKKLLTSGRIDRVESKHQAKGLSPKTVRNIHQILASAMKLAREQGALYEIERLTFTKALETFDSLCRAGSVSEEAMLFVNSIANTCLSHEDGKYINSHWHELCRRMVVEITEEEEIDYEALERKRNAPGFSGMFALDDYGSGYNGEAMLLAVQPDYVKIDVAIVRGVDQDDDKRQLVENLVSYAHVRGIALVGEGVETRAELEALAALGVDYVQGYFLARPALLPPPVTPEGAECLRALRGEMD